MLLTAIKRWLFGDNYASLFAKAPHPAERLIPPELRPYLENTMARELKIWNGRAGCCHKCDDPLWEGIQPYRGHHKIYAAAYSRADLRRLIAEYCGRDPGETEIRDYWNAGAWGMHMDGITPERGLWLRKDSPEALPVRLI